jgi:hypothetical protein
VVKTEAVREPAEVYDKDEEKDLDVKHTVKRLRAR